MIKINLKIKNKSLTNGVLVLLISNLVVKIIGVLFKIPLVNIMGDDGMGYFNSAYTVYTFFYTVSTSGLPVALSILIAKCDTEKRYADKARVYKVALVFFEALGLVFTLFMSLGSKMLGDMIGNSRASSAILAIAPVMLFICVISARRGYFQGHQNMMPTALSQLIEAVGKLCFGIMFSLYAVRRGYSYPIIAAFAILGITLSEALCMLCLMLFPKARERSKEYTITDFDALKSIIKTALPITLSSVVLSLTSLADLGLVMNRLVDIGYTEQEANALFGNYTGLAVPLFNLPASLITPIALSIVPYIASALAQKDAALGLSTLKSSLKSSLIIAFPCAFGMSALSEPILSLIFDDAQASRAAMNLSVLAIGIIGLALTSVSAAILQAYGRTYLPIVSVCIGCAVKLVAGYILIGELGIIGTPISTVICYSTTALFNLVWIYKRIGGGIALWDGCVKPMVCALVCAVVGYFSYGAMATKLPVGLSCILAIALAGVVYVVMALITRLMNSEDTKVFPGGKYIDRIILKLKR